MRTGILFFIHSLLSDNMFSGRTAFKERFFFSPPPRLFSIAALLLPELFFIMGILLSELFIIMGVSLQLFSFLVLSILELFSIMGAI